jgi:hypothetical protein
MGGTFNTKGEMRNACKIWIGNPERIISFARFRHSSEDSDKMDREDVDWIELAQDRLHC